MMAHARTWPSAPARPARRPAWSRATSCKALGVGDELAHSSIRFGLGRFNTEEEVDFVIAGGVPNRQRLRAMSPVYGAGPDQPELATAVTRAD